VTPQPTSSAAGQSSATIETEYDWNRAEAYAVPAFFAMLDELVDKYFYGFYHPLGRRMISGELSQRELRLLAVQEYPYYACTTWWNAGKILNAHTLEQQRLLHGPLLDELGEDLIHSNGLPAHSDLFLRYCAGLGLTRSDVESAPLAPAVVLAVTELRNIAATRPVFEFLSVSNLVVERMRPRHYTVFLQAFERHYTWVPKEALKFYEIHAGLDKDHESIGRRIVAQYAVHKRDQDAVFASVLKSIVLRLAMYDGIERMLSTPGAVGMIRWPNFPGPPWPRPLGSLAESD
jgi:pyrroloquinoline quinone (PQQ) biosynthesis protein C